MELKTLCVFPFYGSTYLYLYFSVLLDIPIAVVYQWGVRGTKLLKLCVDVNYDLRRGSSLNCPLLRVNNAIGCV